MTCSHYFIITPPNGVKSIGVCKLCGEKREMLNWIEGGGHAWKKTNKGFADAAKDKKGELM